ncbi:unnamed protein product [Mycena citricolor]|uniref:Uncharacterized protein n=1 Tax=Mycena citricolor TaxID=2018698 RepID=A0AAD2I096_9AGAR|nr:unnamed protein product [Mycena citricolor]
MDWLPSPSPSHSLPHSSCVASKSFTLKFRDRLTSRDLSLAAAGIPREITNSAQAKSVGSGNNNKNRKTQATQKIARYGC